MHLVGLILVGMLAFYLLPQVSDLAPAEQGSERGHGDEHEAENEAHGDLGHRLWLVFNPPARP